MVGPVSRPRFSFQRNPSTMADLSSVTRRNLHETRQTHRHRPSQPGAGTPCAQQRQHPVCRARYQAQPVVVRCAGEAGAAQERGRLGQPAALHPGDRPVAAPQGAGQLPACAPGEDGSTQAGQASLDHQPGAERRPRLAAAGLASRRRKPEFCRLRAGLIRPVRCGRRESRCARPCTGRRSLS